MKSRPKCPRKIVRPAFWYPRSWGRIKLKRVLYRMRHPVGRTIQAGFWK